MKRYLKTLVFALFFTLWSITTYGQQGWILQQSGPANLNDISASSGTHATAVGQNFVILHTENAGQSWTAQTGETGIDYHAVSFANDSIGLIAGTSGTILFTNNSGTNWETIETGWMYPYYAAHQPTSSIGVVAGINSIFQPIVGLTSNSWQNRDFHVFYPQHNGSSQEGTIHDTYFFDANHGIAVLETWNWQGAICTTANGGVDWNTVQWSDHAFFGIDFWDENHGCAVGEGGTAMLTSNGGETWEFSDAPTHQTLLDASYGSLNDLWIVGTAGMILYSNDGGITFDWQTSPYSGNLNGISMVNADTGYIAGNAGTILFTSTGGEIINHPPGEFWRVLPTDSDTLSTPLVNLVWTHAVDLDGNPVSYLAHIWSDFQEFRDSTNTTDTIWQVVIPWPLNPLDDYYQFFWTVDATDGNNIVEATNGRGIFIDDIIMSADDHILHPSSFILSAYPNPFNPTTTISFTLTKQSKVKLMVYDIAGRLVETLANEHFIAGEHQLNFDGSSFASGIYFARLEAENFVQTQKMILLK